MNKSIILMSLHLSVAALLLFITGSCVHELPQGESEVAVTLHLRFATALPQHTTVSYESKADVPYSVRYLIRVYKVVPGGLEATPSYQSELLADVSASLDRDFSFLLPRGNYKALIWTDYSGDDGAFYNAADFSSVRFTEPYRGAEAYRDAFYGVQGIDLQPLLTNDASFQVTVPMSRPLARFDFVASDREAFLDYWAQQLAIRSGTYVKPDLSDIDISQFRVRIIYPQYLPNSFGLNTGRPADSAVGLYFDTVMHELPDGQIDLGFDWMFIAGGTGSVVVSLEFYDADGELISAARNIEVPLMRSQNTTVIGKFLTGGIHSGIAIDNTFDGEYTIHL